MKTIATIALLLTAAANAALAADVVKGQFKIANTVVAPKQVFAFSKRDGFNPRQEEICVMLTDTAVDQQKILQDIDSYTSAINDPATDANHLKFFIDNKGGVTLNAKVNGTQYLDSSGTMMGQKGSLQVDCGGGKAGDARIDRPGRCR